MKSIVRSLLVWLLLLALPFQGVAAARMLPCVADGIGARTAMAAPAHATMAHDASASARASCHDASGAQSAARGQPHDGAASHDGAKSHPGASHCAACCIGAAMASALPPLPAMPSPPSASIPFRAGHVPSVDPALPERPPRTALA
ncbi:hypothetical protein HH212_24340 [Massilia forsythiae]|uniref:DUF2946 domain-containing protein n=1 Tax=Massilia forsythiae TaxID=2728020 RepID=A0A7Z2W0B0_9BURK|nr:hypothetical protein [Massilia forsythiae]QJE02746.1 hypothetical protein HH212_24340 [Massilia forsythiae]